MIDVLSPGLLTTVQDLGRSGWTHLGVSPAGACDTLSVRIGNLLVGNPEGAAALEFSFTAPALRFERAALVAITGATCEHAPVAPWSSFHVEAGEVLRLGGLLDGAHAYLCVRGGIAVEPVLGSASTHLPSRLGGLNGRALQKGDRLSVGVNPAAPPAKKMLPSGFDALVRRSRRLRVTSGAHTELLSAQTIFDFLSGRFEVNAESNRQGIRISGVPLRYPGEIASEGVALGNVQLLPNGGAVILSVDSQTTGGYPVIAAVISADLRGAGQLRPGDEVTFEAVTIDHALAALQEQHRLLHELRRLLAC